MFFFCCIYLHSSMLPVILSRRAVIRSAQGKFGEVYAAVERASRDAGMEVHRHRDYMR